MNARAYRIVVERGAYYVEYRRWGFWTRLMSLDGYWCGKTLAAAIDTIHHLKQQDVVPPRQVISVLKYE